MSGSVGKLLCVAAFVAVALPAAAQTVPFRDEAPGGSGETRPIATAAASAKLPASQPAAQAPANPPQVMQPQTRIAHPSPATAPAVLPPAEPPAMQAAAVRQAPAQKLQPPAQSSVAHQPLPQQAVADGAARPRGRPAQRPDERRIMLTALANGWPLTEATPYWK